MEFDVIHQCQLSYIKWIFVKIKRATFLILFIYLFTILYPQIKNTQLGIKMQKPQVTLCRHTLLLTPANLYYLSLASLISQTHPKYTVGLISVPKYSRHSQRDSQQSNHSCYFRSECMGVFIITGCIYCDSLNGIRMSRGIANLWTMLINCGDKSSGDYFLCSLFFFPFDY